MTDSELATRNVKIMKRFSELLPIADSEILKSNKCFKVGQRENERKHLVKAKEILLETIEILNEQLSILGQLKDYGIIEHAEKINKK